MYPGVTVIGLGSRDTHLGVCPSLFGELMSAMRTRKQIAVLQHTQGKRMAPDAWKEDM